MGVVIAWFSHFRFVLALLRGLQFVFGGAGLDFGAFGAHGVDVAGRRGARRKVSGDLRLESGDAGVRLR